MKTNSYHTPALAALAISSLALPAAEEDWTIVLIQRQLESGATQQTPVGVQGSRAALAPVPEGGSEFQLWALNPDAGLDSETLIDTEVVAAFLPNGELSITTPDDHVGDIPRTRIDQGFTLNYEVSGLLPNTPDAPAAAKEVLLDHGVASYQAGFIKGEDNFGLDSGNNSNGGGLVGGVLEGALSGVSELLTSLLGTEANFAQRSLSRNGRDQIVFPTANIPGGDIYADAGVETFRLHALADETTAETKLAEAKVRVWPLAQATVKGIVPDETYTRIPRIEVDLKSLYPESETWVQIYPGSQVLGTEGTILNESTIQWDDEVPLSTSLVFRDLDRLLTTEGQWTLEVLTETPFGVERLAWRSLVVGRTLEVRGMLNGLSN